MTDTWSAIPSLTHGAVYFAWGAAQQVVYQSMTYLPLRDNLKSRGLAAGLAGAAFSIMHVPAHWWHGWVSIPEGLRLLTRQDQADEQDGRRWAHAASRPKTGAYYDGNRLGVNRRSACFDYLRKPLTL